ncbi:hypothetical protein [Pseudomonas luteola]|uniref:hypothetical protein n=1 Tax=Pseudomonas luteola TaxID=47886 RepID=UPI00289FF000|nr:hypothetical protein [Pseudomonas luteola]
MSDRELLELAAKAAGYKVKFGASGDPYIQAGINTRAWNPLTDDGDALRLAVKLKIRFEAHPRWPYVAAFALDIADRFEEEVSGDEMSATRRAIVRAAAEIGRAMP